jgi:hypothetical protein
VQQDLVRRQRRSSFAFIGELLARLGGLRRLQAYIDQANLKYRAVDVSIAGAAAGGVAYVVLGVGGFTPILLRLLFAAMVACIPLFLVLRVRRRRLRKFEDNLPDAIDLFNRSMKAGHNIHAGLETLAAETARVCVATSELYPRLALNGSIGIETLSFREPASSRTWTASGGPQLSWAVFDPTVRPRIQVQSEVQRQALIQYEATVLGSLEEVENALVAYVQELQRRESLREATKAAQAAADLAQYKYQAGLTDFTTVLDAERSLLSFQDSLNQSDGTVTSDVIRLYQALGGGWTSMAAVPAATETAK